VAEVKVSEPVDYVSPNIGTIGQLLAATMPYVQTPHGMARLAPVTTPGITDRYLADKIYAFPAGPAWLMAATGKTSTQPAGYASSFDHDFETATPYYHEVDLQSSDIKAEFTATQTAAYYRFTFPADEHAHLVLSLEKESELTVVGAAAAWSEGGMQEGSPRGPNPGDSPRPSPQPVASVLACFGGSGGQMTSWPA